MTLGDTLRHLGLSASDDPRTDGDLLTLFVRSRDEAAFAELLRRHGPTVLGVCRRILGNSHDADDAFQAAFLVLARKADAVRPPGMVGNWLYGVAVRTANKARVMNAKRAKRAATARERGVLVNPDRGEGGAVEVMELIDAELASLPGVYRAAFVACDLNGRSRSEAARELGWPEGTVAARLAKARELLAGKLRKRGVTLAAGTLAVVLVPPTLAVDTHAAVRELAAVGTAHTLAPAAQQLSDEVVRAMAPFNWKLITAGIVTITLAVGTAALIAAPDERPGPRPERKQMTNAPVPKANTEWKEAKPIELAGDGRVTSVAYSPSGETLAVCRDTGAIHFLKAKTRERLTEMAVKHDPKVNPNVEVAAYTALAFRPTPHPKLGDVFAVTHKNGVRVGTVNIGILADNGAAVDGLPSNWTKKDFDPHQVVWLGDGLMATNGEDTRHCPVPGLAAEVGYTGWADRKHKPCVLAAVPGKSAWLMQFANKKAADHGIWCWEPPNFSDCRLLEGHKSRPVAAAVSGDGKRIVSADEGGTLIVWEGEKFAEKSRVELGSGVVQLALAPDGKTTAVLRTTSASSGTTTAGTTGGDGTSSTIDISSADTDFELFVFDATNPPAKPNPIWKTEKPFAWGFAGPASLAFSPDGKTLLAAFADPYYDVTGGGKTPKSSGVRVWELVPKK